jgi:hypothetical protein
LFKKKKPMFSSDDYSDQYVPDSSGSDLENSPSISAEESDVDVPSLQDDSAGELALRTQLATWKIENRNGIGISH